MEANQQPDQFDIFLTQIKAKDTEEIQLLIEEEDQLMFQIFAGSYAALEEMAFWVGHLIEDWDHWTKQKKDILKRCENRGLIRVEFTKPSEVAFQLWSEVARVLYRGSPISDEELRKEFFQNYKALPLVYVSIEGAKLIADLAEAK